MNDRFIIKFVRNRANISERICRKCMEMCNGNLETRLVLHFWECGVKVS